MIKFLSTSLLVFIAVCLNAQVIIDSIDCNYLQTPLEQFIKDIEQETNLKFYYKPEMIKNISVTVNGKNIHVFDAISRGLRYTSYTFTFYEPNMIVIVPNDGFVDHLPFDHLVAKNFAKPPQDEFVSRMQKKYLKGRKVNVKKIITVGNSNVPNTGQRVTVNGKLLDYENGEPLIGATFYIKELGLGTATDEDGDMILFLPPGKYSSSLSCIGMQKTEIILNVKSAGSFSFAMQREVKTLTEVTVNAQQAYKIRGSEIGLDKLSIKSVKELPSLMGEKDIIKIAQLLPGVVSVSEGVGGVNVRGGNADQNLFYINNLPLYNSSHLFGFFSAINSSIVKNFAIYKGHIPAEYGGRLSSVFLIDTRKGNKKKLFAQGGISPISANLEIEGPIKKDTSSFVVSGRSSYSDWILKRISNDNLKRSRALFYDFSASADFMLNEKNNISTFLYHSNDEFNLNNANQYDYTNFGGGLYYIHKFSPLLKFKLNLVNSLYAFTTIDNSYEPDAYQHSYDINHTELKANFNYLWTERNKVEFGISAINYRINRGKILPYGESSKRKISDLGKESAIESALFVEDKYEITKWMNLSAGLRYSFYSYYGPNNLYIYRSGSARIEKNITDTLSFNSFESIKNYNAPELRVGLNFKLSEWSSIKLSYIKMQQYTYLLSNTYAITPTDQWKLSDYYSKPASSDQYSAGFYKTFVGLGFSLSAETYYKNSINVTEFADGADFLNTKLVETQTIQGLQEAYGVEFMIAKDEGKLNGWASYTYSRSFMDVQGINENQVYPSNFDKPNVFNLTANYKFNRRVILSANLMYSTGRPITMPIASYYYHEMQIPQYSSRNEYRTPDYFRTDLSLTLEGNLKANKKLHSYWMINVYNLTGRKNPYSIYFRLEDGKLKGYSYSVIGVPIFTVSWNFKLGNYANE